MNSRGRWHVQFDTWRLLERTAAPLGDEGRDCVLFSNIITPKVRLHRDPSERFFGWKTVGGHDVPEQTQVLML